MLQSTTKARTASIDTCSHLLVIDQKVAPNHGDNNNNNNNNNNNGDQDETR